MLQINLRDFKVNKRGRLDTNVCLRSTTMLRGQHSEQVWDCSSWPALTPRPSANHARTRESLSEENEPVIIWTQRHQVQLINFHWAENRGNPHDKWKSTYGRAETSLVPFSPSALRSPSQGSTSSRQMTEGFPSSEKTFWTNQILLCNYFVYWKDDREEVCVYGGEGEVKSHPPKSIHNTNNKKQTRQNQTYCKMLLRTMVINMREKLSVSNAVTSKGQQGRFRVLLVFVVTLYRTIILNCVHE